MLSNKVRKIVAISLIGLTVGTGVTAIATDGFKNIGGLTSLPTGEEENSNSYQGNYSIGEQGGISVKEAFTTEDQVTQSFTYTVTPARYTGTISYSVSCPSDSTYAYGSYLEITHDRANKKVSVKVLAPFEKRFVLTLFADEDPTKKADINIDYRKKFEAANPTITLKEGEKLSLNPNVTFSKGTLEATNGTVSEEKIAYYSGFFAKVSAIQIEHSPTAEIQHQPSITGNMSDPTWFKTNNFNTYDFLSAIFYTVKIDTDYFEVNLSMWSSAWLSEIFNETNPVFTYSFKVCGQSISANLPYKLTPAPVEGINSNGAAIIF